MGIFDEIRKIVDTAGKPSTPTRAPGHAHPAGHRPASSPAQAGLRDAQQRRRAAGVQRANGKPATPRKLNNYERLERQIAADAGAFPFTSEQARQALAARGFDAAHVEAYLRSPAARKLLE